MNAAEQASGPWKNFDACLCRAQQVQRNAASTMGLVATWPPHADRTHVVLHLELGSMLRSQRSKGPAQELAYVLKYLDKLGMDVQGVQVERGGLGDWLIALLRKKGVKAQPLPTLCKPSGLCMKKPFLND